MLFVQAIATVSQQMDCMLDTTRQIVLTVLAVFQVVEIIRRQR